MFNISEFMLLDICENMGTYIRGRSYYLNNKVKELEYFQSSNLFKAIVKGNEYYYVEVIFDREGFLKYTSCTCPAYEKYEGCCKHIIAVLFDIIARDRCGEFDSSKSSVEVERIIDYFRSLNTDKKVPLKLEITYEFAPYGHEVENASYLSLRIGEKNFIK